jgi:hypothetical protein
MTLGFIVHNRSQELVICGITNSTNPSASNAWYELHPGASTGMWPRMGWEDVVFKSKDGSKQKSLWVNRGAPALVYFNGFDNDITVQNNYRPEPGFTVINHTDRPIYASVTTNSGGSSNWFFIKPGGQEPWKRTGWETVAIKNENDSDRKGIYINNQGSRTTIGFRGLNQDFDISHASLDNSIREEHYAEALRIADRSFAAQNTRASTPGGLMASVQKINVLESMTTGLIIHLPFSFQPPSRRIQRPESQPLGAQSNLHPRLPHQPSQIRTGGSCPSGRRFGPMGQSRRLHLRVRRDRRPRVSYSSHRPNRTWKAAFRRGHASHRRLPIFLQT